MNLSRFRSVGRAPFAFTLIELLVVISIIAILAALMFPTIRGVDGAKRLSRAKGELAQVQSFIESYKDKLGYYPPDNRNPTTGELLSGMNQLYYELDGTILTNGNTFLDQDLMAPPMDNLKVASFFGPGVVGFMNCSRGDSDQAGAALKILRGLRPDQVATVNASNPVTHLNVTARMLVCSVAGPDPNKPPLNNGDPPLNPWRYNSSSPTNNPGSYDLWADIFANGKTYRICNWSSKPLLVYK